MRGQGAKKNLEITLEKGKTLHLHSFFMVAHTRAEAAPRDPPRKMTGLVPGLGGPAFLSL